MRAPGTWKRSPARRGSPGQALLEALVALFVLSLAILSLTGLAGAAAAGMALDRVRARAGDCAQAALEASRYAGAPIGQADCLALASGPAGATVDVEQAQGPDGSSGALWKATVRTVRGAVLADVWLVPPPPAPSQGP